MLAELLDSFGFVSVILRAIGLASQALMLGGIVFVVFILPSSMTIGRRLIAGTALIFALAQTCYVALDSALLMISTGLQFRDVVGADFFVTGSVGAFAAIAIFVKTIRPRWKPTIGVLLLGIVTLSSLVLTSHAAGRLSGRWAFFGLNAIHQAASAAWIGGLPYLLLSLAKTRDVEAAQTLCRRFSAMAMLSVLALAIAGLTMAAGYMGSPAAVYGTSYGLMLGSKVILTGGLLILGGLNFAMVRRPAGSGLPYLRRCVEAELGVGLTIVLAAASLGSQPPAIDRRSAWLSASEIAQRTRPTWPRLTTPPPSALSPPTSLDPFPGRVQDPPSWVPGESYSPSNPGDIAWSEYNHHWSGLIVLAAGLLAFAARLFHIGWAQHWPLSFLGLAIFLFLRADPENWPLGPHGFWESFAVAEVLQHRVFVLLITAFAIFQWSIETRRIGSPRWALIFPVVCAAGGALLLTHSHSLSNVKEEALTELSHAPLALLGVAAGWTRWLELRLPGRSGTPLALVWPVCFILIGLVLLNYREA